MTRNIKRTDGSTIDIEKQQAEQSEVPSRAKRVINVGPTGLVINPKLEQSTNRDLFSQMITELRILNNHMEILTEEKIIKNDIKF